MGPTVTATGTQPWSARFKQRQFSETPLISRWRCNLTGLSQIHNLYFVAYGADIYVYVPQFPKQTIAGEPVLIFASQPSAPHLTGHLDTQVPHAINNLVVQFLGTEEVVAAVRDDGDVDAFLVRHIVQGIERRAETGFELGLRAEEIRPFFQSNVGKSAWGLAIHAEARILATSANTHEIRVFKFGLLQADDNEASGDEPELASPVHHAGVETDPERKTDVTYQILNGEANIPYIAFCNTGDDPDGRWLLTTDIAGVCQVMDLKDMKPVQKFRFGRSLVRSNLYEDRFDRLNAGWSIMFLDRRSFKEEESRSALGLGDDDVLPWDTQEPTIWDISETVKHLPEYTEPFIFHRPKRRKTKHDPDDNEDAPEEDADALPTEEDGASEGESAIDSDASSDGGAPLDAEAGTEEGSSNQDETALTEPETLNSDSASTSDSDEEGEDEEAALIDDAEDPEDEGTEDTIPFTAWYNGQTIKVNEPQFARTLRESSFWDKLPCPILHGSVRNIYLLQPFTNSNQLQPAQIRERPWVPPMLGLANPLRRAISQDFEYLRNSERLNMAVSIPPLGIVVLASQKGRALVLSLTKISPRSRSELRTEGAAVKHAARRKNAPREEPAWMDKTHYSMRVECIIPFAYQENVNQRPFAPLHGIAASPLQGCSEKERVAGERRDGSGNGERWRLMMMYQDHSILSYEIGRQSGWPGGSRDMVDLEELVV